MSPLPHQGGTLYDVAPRLAVARDQRRVEISCIDGDGFKVGDEFSKILSASHRVERCRHCGGDYDVHQITKRLLVGCNCGVVAYDTLRKCRRCRTAWSSHR